MPSPTAVVGISNAPERSRTSTSLFSSQGPQPRAGLADISEPCVTCLGSPGYSFSAPNIFRTAEAQIAATPGHPVSVICRANWPEVTSHFGLILVVVQAVAAAMIDRLVHHAEILALKGDSYQLRDKDLGAPPPGD